MIELLVATAAAYGTFLLYTAFAFRWRGIGLGPKVSSRRFRRPRIRDWMTQAGLGDVGTGEFVGVVTILALVSGLVGAALFGGLLPALALAVFGGSAPVASYRFRRAQRRARSQEAWPRMIEEIRLRTGALGRSIPQALFEVGARGPHELRPAFDEAHREWLLTTDFERTIAVLKDQLADPTADVTCETLLVAHQLGGADLGRRLTALAEDRIQDVQGRKDARAKQAGARLARRFVILVPIGMAVVGLQIGEGRAAYGTVHGQVVVLVAIGLVAICWAWAGQIMRLPETERVLS
ncbi:MAG: type II secretion system F family protein [Acidimicrobiales bacterium]